MAQSDPSESGETSDADGSWVSRIHSFWLIVNALFDGLWMLLERGQLIRRFSYMMMMYITVRYIFWAMDFAQANGQSASDKGLLIGAIGVPLSALQGYVFKLYEQGRGDTLKISDEVRGDLK